jgi:predicted dinucleotide-binding enzyme
MTSINLDRRLFLCIGAALAAALGLASVPAAAAGETPLKVGIIGAGREGGALGTLLVKAGHPVMFASRHPEELKGFVAGLGPLATAGTVAEAIDFGDVVMIVVPYTAIPQIGRDYGRALAKKAAVIDVSNPIARRDGADLVKSVAEQGGAGLATERMLPRAHIVRAFNAISYLKLPADAHRSGEPVGVPIAGNNREAIAIVADLIRQMGFEPVLVGGLAMGKYLVPGTPLGGEHTPAEIRKIAAGLE